MARAHRTYWKIRQRYRWAGFAGSVLGGFGAAAMIAPIVHGAEWSAEGLLVPTLVQWAALSVGAVALPPVLARSAWRMHRRRYFEDMYRITQR